MIKLSNASLDNFDRQLIHPLLYQTVKIAGGKGGGIGLAWKPSKHIKALLPFTQLLASSGSEQGTAHLTQVFTCPS